MYNENDQKNNSQASCRRDSGLLLPTIYLTPFLDTTTFEVNVTACDVENSFIFDNEA